MIHRIPWTEKPPEGTPLNLAHPMARDLFFFCAMDRPGNQIDLVHDRAGTLLNPGADILTPVVQTPEGVACFFRNIDAPNLSGFLFGNTGGSGYYDAPEITIISRVRPGLVDDSGAARIVSKRFVGGGNDRWMIATFQQVLPVDRLLFRANGAGDEIIRTSGSWQKTLIDVALAVNSGGQDNYVWEVETGLQQELVGQTGATITGDAGNLTIGHRDDEARSFDGTIHYVAVFGDRKTKAFIEEFRQNPWQIFEPLIVPGFALPSAEISASVPMFFDVVADLKAAGQLDAGIQTALSLVADLKAAGELDAAIALALTVAADLKAAGQLDAAVDLTLSLVADLRAAGQVDAAIDLTFSIVADLKSAPGLGRSYTRRLLGVIHE